MDKKVIGKRSMLLSSLGRRSKRMQPLNKSQELVDFITKAAKSLKKGDEFRVRFSFGVAQEGDEMYELEELQDDEEEYRFSQMSQDEPRIIMSSRDMSKKTRLDPKGVKDFLLDIYRSRGPWKHGFAQEHMQLWKSKLYSYPELITAYKRQTNENKISTMKDLITADELRDSCFGLEPEENEYPPNNISYKHPPTLQQWAHRNGKRLKSKEDESTALELELLREQINLTKTMDANIPNRHHNDNASTQSHSLSSTRQLSHSSSSSSAVHSHEFVTINIGRKRMDKSVRFVSLYVGETRTIKPSMTLASIQVAKPKIFTKQNDKNDLQASVKIDLNGSLHHHEEEDFGEITLQSIIDVCNFDTSTVPIEIVIEEFTD